MSSPPSDPRTDPATPPVHLSEDLLGGAAAALIRHGEAVYTLRLTRAGKLILTK